jgi:hypothetical protein
MHIQIKNRDELALHFLGYAKLRLCVHSCLTWSENNARDRLFIKAPMKPITEV